jgi:hypothetical protein
MCKGENIRIMPIDTQDKLTEIENAVRLLYMWKLITFGDLEKIKTRLVKRLDSGK